MSNPGSRPAQARSSNPNPMPPARFFASMGN